MDSVQVQEECRFRVHVDRVDRKQSTRSLVARGIVGVERRHKGGTDGIAAAAFPNRTNANLHQGRLTLM